MESFLTVPLLGVIVQAPNKFPGLESANRPSKPVHEEGQELAGPGANRPVVPLAQQASAATGAYLDMAPAPHSSLL